MSFNPAVWPTLKRAIKDREVRIEEPYEQFGSFRAGRPATSADADRRQDYPDRRSQLYQMLAAYDEDFFEIFRVKSDFDYEVKRTKENMLGMPPLLAAAVRNAK